MFFRGQKKTSQDVSINEPIETDKDGNSLTLMDTMCDDGDIIDELDLKMKCSRLYKILHILDKREREIIVLRYGLFGGKPLAQREVAAKLKISRSYVSRIEKQAVEKLRNKFSE